MKKTIKSILSLTIALAMVFSMAVINVNAAARTGSLTASVEEAEAGDSVVISVFISQASGMTALEYDLAFDKEVWDLDLTINGETERANFADMSWFLTNGASNRLNGPEIGYKADVGAISLASARSSGISVDLVDYQIGKFTLTVKADAPAGATDFTLVGKAQDADAVGTVPFTNNPQSVTVVINGEEPTGCPFCDDCDCEDDCDSCATECNAEDGCGCGEEPQPTPEPGDNDDTEIILGDAEAFFGAVPAIVPVSFANIEEINSANIVITYDTAKLSFVGKSAIDFGAGFPDGQFECNVENGVITIVFASSTAYASDVEVFNLAFDAVADGPYTSDVVVTSAKYGNGGKEYVADIDVLGTAVVTVTSVPDDVTPGDVTLDGKVDSNDAVWVLWHVGGGTQLTGESLANGLWFNSNKPIDAALATKILLAELGR